MGPLVREPRSYDAAIAQQSLRSAGCVRRRGPGQLRQLGPGSRLRLRMAADGGGRLGALSLRPLGVGRLVWVDLGQLRSVGLGAVSLRALVPWEPRLVLVSGRDRRAALLVARAGRLDRIRRRRRIWIRLPQYRLGTAGALRNLPSLVGT